MELLSYKDFGLLRMRDFWPGSAQIGWFDSYTTLLGHASCNGEVYGHAYFIRDPRTPNDLGGIALESLAHDSCPEGAADRLLARLKLPLRAGMATEQIIDVMGDPVRRGVIEPRIDDLEFIVGADHPYRVFCAVWPETGLQYIAVLRNDLYLRRIAAESMDDDDD